MTAFAETTLQPLRPINSSATEQIIRHTLGDQAFDRHMEEDPATTLHGLETGELNAMALGQVGCSVKVVDLGRLVGGTHDWGKVLMHPVHRDFARSGDEFSRPYRRWFSDEHAWLGGRFLNRKARAYNSPSLAMAGMVAARHHGPVAEKYWKFPSPEALAEGLLHLTKVSDVLQAVGFDESPARGYKEKRERRPVRTNEDVFGIVMDEWQKNCPGNPIVDGHRIDIEEFVTSALSRRPEA